MGRLVKLEIENFKSYSGKQIIGPFDDFNCIIGPNGAGKSNMMDAISFVLGIQSKHLRSTQLKDLIFRQNLDSKSARKAEVKLFYSYRDDDNDTTDKTIIFSRSVISSGSTSYKINGSEVPFDQYDSSLSSIGVLVKARNFLVFQGDIESVAQKSPIEFTKLIEQISGSEQYRPDYELLQSKKNQSEESLLVILQKKKLLVSQRKEVKEQKDESEKYFSKLNEIRDLKSKVALWRIWKIKGEIEMRHSNAIQFRSDLEGLSKLELDLEKEFAENKSEQFKISKKMNQAEKQLSQKSHELELIESALMEVNAKLTNFRRRKLEFEKSKEGATKDNDKQKSTVALLRAEILTLNNEENALQTKLEEIKNSLGGDELTINQYAKLKEDSASIAVMEKTEKEVLLQDIKSIQLRASQILKEKEAVKLELTNATNVMEDYKIRISNLQTGIRSNKTERDGVAALKVKAVEDLERRNDELNKCSAELDFINSKLAEAKDDIRRSKQEIKESEAVETMMKIFPGVRGKLVDLCRPIQKKYVHAVAVAAGKHMDAIVVDSKQVASECIKYLKDQRIGTFLFLPLDNIKSRPVPERLRSFGAKYHFCADLIESEDRFKSAVNYAVGSTIVCDTLEDAQHLCFDRHEQVKAVTLRGQVIGKTGAMTGGLSSLKDMRDRWREKELDNLRQRKIFLEDFLSTNNSTERQNVIEFENKIQSLQAQVQFSTTELTVIQEKFDQISQVILRHSQEADKLTEKYAELETLLKNRESSLNALQQVIDNAEREYFSSFAQSKNIINIREYEETKLVEHQNIFSKLRDISGRKTDLLAHLEYELKKKYDSLLLRVEEQINQVNRDILSLEAEHDKLSSTEQQKRIELSEQSKLYETNKIEKDKLIGYSKEIHQKRADILKEKDSFLAKISLEEIGAEKSRTQLHEVLRQTQIDEVELPMIEMEDSSSSEAVSDSFWSEHLLRLEFSKYTDDTINPSTQGVNIIDGSEVASHSLSHTTVSAHFSESQNPVVKRDSSKMMRVDLSSVDSGQRYNEKSVEDKISQYESLIKELNAEIQTMQPNFHAAERYETIMLKIDEVNKELEELKNVTKDVSTEFDRIKSLRLNCFKDCYSHVSEALGLIYRDLTRSSKHPLGGNAFLSIDNNDEPYLGGIRFTAMPPMKRFRDMDQLSGGEKTIAALALLFSIHSFRQAPFFVLDEVDAALDNVNVKKICNYIKQRSKDFQCIVISLKDMFYENSDALIGVYKDVKTLSSKILTLSLREYD